MIGILEQGVIIESELFEMFPLFNQTTYEYVIMTVR